MYSYIHTLRSVALLLRINVFQSSKFCYLLSSIHCLVERSAKLSGVRFRPGTLVRLLFLSPEIVCLSVYL